MDFPIKAFEINGLNGECVKLEILNVYDFPNRTSFRGDYDINCKLEIDVGNYLVKTDNYLSPTGTLYNFYIDLKRCFDSLNGHSTYNVYIPENDLKMELDFKNGHIFINGLYRDDPSLKNVLTFEFKTDQSYFPPVIKSLKNIVDIFGDNKGIKK